MSSIEAFVGHIRHELRTPVNAILGYSQLLLEEDDASLTVEERRDLERVTEAGHQLLRIVVEALDPAELIGDDVASAPCGCATHFTRRSRPYRVLSIC